MQSAGKDEAGVGDMLAALMREARSHAVEVLAGQGVTRLDVLNFISHGVRKAPPRDRAGEGEGEAGATPAGEGEEGAGPSRDPLAAFASNLTDRAREGKLDPVIGRVREMGRALEVLCRRRKNNPVFVGEPGVGKTAIVEGLAQKLLEEGSPEALKGAEIFALDTGALLAGTRYRGDFEERFKAVIQALKKRPLPVLFIDEMHTMVGAGATTGGTMDLANLIKPILTEGEIRLMGSTTFEEFKHIEKDRALARRVQRIDVDEPNEGDTVRILQGLRPRYEEHHKVTYTDGSLEVSARLARRHLRDLRLPGQRHRRDRRGGGGAAAQPAGGRAAGGGHPGGRAGRVADGAHPRDPGLDLRPRAAAHAGRGPEAGGLRAGRGGRPGGLGHQAGARGARPAGAAGRRLPLHRPHRGREDGARQAARAATSATSSSATT